MPLTLLRPGQTAPDVPKLKTALVRALLERNHDQVASLINPSSRTYGPKAVHGVKVFQRDKKMTPDGIVGAGYVARARLRRAGGRHAPACVATGGARTSRG